MQSILLISVPLSLEWDDVYILLNKFLKSFKEPGNFGEGPTYNIPYFIFYYFVLGVLWAP